MSEETKFKKKQKSVDVFICATCLAEHSKPIDKESLSEELSTCKQPYYFELAVGRYDIGLYKTCCTCGRTGDFMEVGENEDQGTLEKLFYAVASVMAPELLEDE